jgi:peptide/nickel transport system substrate-binding protein
VLAACSTGGGDEADGDGAAAEGGDTLVVGVTSDPDTLFPWKATQFQAVDVLQNLYGTLTTFDDDLEVVPGLAESWETSEDGLTLTLHLREGVTFHDGSEFDSADVVHSLESIMDEATAAVGAATLASVESVEAPDASTVVLTLSAADSSILAGLASINLAMVSSDDSEETLTTAANGTGPFELGERSPNESLTLTSYADHWDGAPELAAVEFRVIPDETSIVSALQSGNVHLAEFDDPLVAESAGGSGVTITETPQLAYHVLQLNARQAPLDDVNVRLAIQCSIDRQEVLDTAAQGAGEVVGPITSPAYLSDPSARPCPERDYDKAREYLAEAGYADGVELDVIVSQGEYATSVNEAQNIQSQLAEAGITVNIEVLESGAYVDRWIAADFTAAVALNGGRPDPEGMYGRYFTSTGNLNPVAGYSSDTLDELFAEGKRTADPDERRAVYDEVALELENNAAWVWLFSSYSYTATLDSVSGYTPTADGSLRNLRETTLQ